MEQEPKISCLFSHDQMKLVKLSCENQELDRLFATRNEHEIQFRRVITYLIKNNFIEGNIIDLGAWIGDNSIPWAMQLPNNTIYAIDPSNKNISYIKLLIERNCLDNVKCIETSIGNKICKVYTNDNIDHCSFNTDSGVTSVDCVSLDYLYEQKQVNDIGFIHLDVEGFESRVMMGMTCIIQECIPIIAFEQHISKENYLYLSSMLFSYGYDVYLINEQLKGCNLDCRNFIAFKRGFDISPIHLELKDILLLLVSPSNVIQKQPKFIATIFGNAITNKNINQVYSVHDTEEDVYIFSVIDDGYTKMVVVNSYGNWIESKYVMGVVNIYNDQNVILARKSSKNFMEKHQYSIGNIVEL